MEVFEHDQQRLACRQCFDDAAGGEEQVAALHRLVPAAQSHEEREIKGRVFRLRRRQRLADQSG